MYIKVAQNIKLTNVDNIQPFKKSRRGRHIMPDAAFERFMLSFEKAHQAISSGSSLESALGFFTDGFSRRAAQEIIFQIGTEEFGKLPWNDIAATLLFYRRGEEVSETEGLEPEVVAPEEIPDVDIGIVETKKPPEAQIIQDGEFKGLTPDQANIIKAYREQDYLDADIKSGNIANMIDRMISGYRKANNPNASDFAKRLALTTDVEVAREFLDSRRQAFLNKSDVLVQEESDVPSDEEESLPEEIEEDSEEAEDLEETEDLEEGDEEIPSSPEIGDEDAGIHSVDVDLREVRTVDTYPSELSEDEVLHRVGLDVEADYFSVKNGEVIINTETFNKAYEHAKTLLTNWKERAIQQDGDRISAPTQGVKNELNIIVHGIRTFDFNIFNKFLEFIDEVDKEIKSKEDKGSNQNLIALRQKLIQQRKNKLEPSLISYQLSRDFDFAQSISVALLYAASFSAFKNYHYTEEFFIDNKNSPLSDSIKKDPQAAQVFIDSLQRRSISGITHSFMKFWRLEIRPLDPDTSRDILGYMNISGKLYFTGAVSDANNRKKGIANFATTTCPTCHKTIEFHSGGSGRQVEEDYAGFIIGVYAPYRQRGKQQIEILSERDVKFDGETERYFAPPGKEYVSQNKLDQKTLDIINKMDPSPKTWDEISDMILSSQFEIQREGLLRRSEALRSVGAVHLKSVNINSTRYLCPMGKHKSELDTNICGLSMKAPEGATRPYQLQPSWNGELPVISNKNNRLVKQYNNSFFEPKDWENAELANIARAKGRGGYKFSKTLFGCPCHITDISEDDDKVYLKHNNVAFKLKEDTYPPTKPDGTLSEVSKDTYAYLVCSANVSLSSVDRNPSSPTFILKYLNTLQNKNPTLFVHLLEFLISNGFDEGELLQMIEDIESNTIISQATDLSRRINSRISRLEEILRKNAVKISSDKTLEAIKDITLICPFGHKFTIEQSLRFGGTHSSFKIQSAKSFKQLSGLIFTEGSINLNNFKSFLVPYDEMSTQKAVYFDEWISLPESKRKINAWHLKAADLVLLKFNIDGKDYVFSSDVAIRQDPLWSDTASRKFEKIQIGRPVINEGLTIQSSDFIGEVSRDDSDEVSAAYSESKTEWEAVMSQILDYNVEEEEHRFSPAIPGGSRTYQNATNLIANMEALNRSLYAAFNIINSWTSTLIHDNLEKSLARQYLEDEQVREVANIVFDNYFNKIIDFESFDEEIDESDFEREKAQAMENLKRFFAKIFIDNAHIISLIRKEDLSPDDAAKQIIKDSISDFIAKYENVSIGDLTLTEDIENVDQASIDKAAEDLAKFPVPQGRFDTETIASKITISDPKKTSPYVKSVGKLTLVAYARFIANAIFKMQNLFFTKSSPLFIGYNPLPETYNSVEDILRISKEDIEKVNVRWGVVSALIDSPQTIYESAGDVEAFGPKYLLMINKAYHYLDIHVKNARSLVITPKSLEAAKVFVQEELGDKYLAEYLSENPKATLEQAQRVAKNRQDLIAKALPVYNVSFNKLVGPSEIVRVTMPDGTQKDIRKYSPFNVLPFFTTGKQKRKGELDHPFYDELEVQTDKESGRKVLINADKGYNSGKLQVGFLTRPTVRDWPLPRFGFYGDVKEKGRSTTKVHVGLPIPFYGDYSAPWVSELRDMLIFNLKPVVELPVSIPTAEEDSATVSTVKVDISFLLERGYSKEHYRMIYNLYNELFQIRQIIENEKERIDNIKNTHPDIIRDLDRQIDAKRGAIERNRGRAGYQRKIIVDEKDLEALVARRDRYVNELENTEKLRERLRLWYEKNISRIQKDFAELPININTKKDLYHIGDATGGVDVLDEGSFSKQKSKIKKITPASVLHVGLADPVLAYNLIMNPEFHGQKYINLGKEKIENEEDIIRNALIDFIVGVYNLDHIARLFVKANRKALEADNYDPVSFSGRDLLIGTATGVFEKEGYKSVSYSGADFVPGNWYDISLEDSSISTYADTDELKEEEVPTFKELMSATDRAKHQGIARPFEERSMNKNLITVSYRAADAMARYIRVITQGTEPESEENEVRDSELLKSSRYLQNILKRSLSLQRIMMKRAATLIDPANLLK